FIFAPEAKPAGQERLAEIMRETKRDLQNALPFAMDPAVYDFEINPHGTVATFLRGQEALMPAGYYSMVVPALLRADARRLTQLRRAEPDRFGAACRARPELGGMVQVLFDRLFPQIRKEGE